MTTIFETSSLKLLDEAVQVMAQGHAHLPDFEAASDLTTIGPILVEAARLMQNNFPYAHPFYAAQMLHPPHTIARLAYSMALFVNPNNHAMDGGRASSLMEKEAVNEIAAMFGWSAYLGHLCGGGTIANLEAAWIADSLHPGKRIVASAQAHYTHSRLTGVLKIPYAAIAVDQHGRMDMAALEAELQAGDIGTVIVTMGTTATGSVDPLRAVLALQKQYGFRIHADCAYGGYYVLADNLLPDTAAQFAVLGQVDSIAIDPHKHGFQPYGCGCILFKDPAVGRFYKHDSPYTYFTSDELHLGEISLECSRPGASAVALWCTQKLYPLVKKGAFTAYLGTGVDAAKNLFQKIAADRRFMTGPAPELDIVVWAPRVGRASESAAITRRIYEQCAAENLHLAICRLPRTLFDHQHPDIEWDQDEITCLRSCLMKSDHLEWIDRIWAVIDRSSND